MGSCNNTIRKITKNGEDYIRTECARGNKISGSLSRPLPYTYPPVPGNTTWDTNIIRIDNNMSVTTNEEWADYIIFLYNHYAQIYDLDPNILAAQAYIESHYVAWNYAQTSSASGISQFIAKTLYGTVMKNQTGYGERFTTEEQNEIIKDFNKVSEYESGDEYVLNSFLYGDNNKGKYYREQLHTNVMNNPHIMIKAQFRYMKYITVKCDNLASSTLFCYNRGPGYARGTYSATVANCQNRAGSKYIVEGVNYVDRIYAVLGDKSGLMFPKASKYKIPNKSFGYDKYFKQYFDKNDLYEAKFYESNSTYNKITDKGIYDPIKKEYVTQNPFGCIE